MSVAWIVLTQGERTAELGRAIRSIRDASGRDVEIVLVENTDRELPEPQIDVPIARVRPRENLGVPGGRNAGVASTDADVVAFLDDDAAVTTSGVDRRLAALFDGDPSLAVVAMRIVDEHGGVTRRHVPRLGRRGADRSGEVAHFLGGACAVRRAAFVDVGGFHAPLMYAHEELDLSWRLHDAGWHLRYEPSIVVEHPRTPIGRHPAGWARTGRNRVIIARRNLPAVLREVHTIAWLAAGVVRCPDMAARRSYLSGWWSGWRASVQRSPMRWSTVARLTRIGRPPVL